MKLKKYKQLVNKILDLKHHNLPANSRTNGRIRHLTKTKDYKLNRTIERSLQI